MNEITTSYSVTFRMTMSPPELDLNLKLIRHAQVFAESLVTTAIEALHQYEYIVGPIQVQGIESSLTRFCKTTLSQHTDDSKPTSFCGIVVTNITVQGPPSSFVPYILTDAIRHYLQRRNSITNNAVEVDFWDRGFRMANLGWRLHGNQSEITSVESINRFQSAVVDFLNDSQPTIKILSASIYNQTLTGATSEDEESLLEDDAQPTTKISSAFIFNQKLIGAGEGEGNLIEDTSTLTVKAVVFGQAALYARENYTSILLSAFDEYPDVFLSRLTGEQENSDTRDAFEVFAIEAPGTTSPTMSPVAMDPVLVINTIETVKEQPNLSYILSAMLIVVCLLSSATGFAIYKRKQTRNLEEKETEDVPPPV